MRLTSVLLAPVLAASLAAPVAARATAPGCSPSWVAAWYGAPVQTVPGLRDRTYRAIVTVHYSGRLIRIRLTNALGTRPVHVDSVTVGRVASLAALEPGSTRVVRFRNKLAVTVPAGRDVLSDPIPLPVTGMRRLAVSFYSATDTGPLTAHTSEPRDAGASPSDMIPVGGYMESHASFVSLPGDHTRDESGRLFVQPDDSDALVSGVDVLPSTSTAGVVALGDSITDGFESTPNADASWPDDLSRRLLQAKLPVSLINAGISGGQVSHAGGRGPMAVERLSRDVLSQSGVQSVIVLEGINDIGNGASPALVISGYRRIISAAHAAGIRVYAGLLTPSGDLTRPFVSPTYSSPSAVAVRHAVNRWMATSGAFDGVIDFESAVKDATFPEHWKTGLSADDLHGNDDGYQAMADAVPLAMLSRGRGCR
ncbi:MAG: lipolytic protein family [Frankiales bacterium]|nr:lipolytic protein family [Frankiales bacterium]